MSRAFTFIVVGSVVLAFASVAGDHGSVCGGVKHDKPLGPGAFRAVLDTVAAGWNSNRAELAASCFTEVAVYLEPPDRQLYRGRAALQEFFATSIAPARSDRLRWHTVAFDSVQQVGFGEYTYRGRQNFHGVVVLHLNGGLIRSWREYQYGSPLAWEEFVGPSR
jgi:SnoaL-like domain